MEKKSPFSPDSLRDKNKNNDNIRIGFIDTETGKKRRFDTALSRKDIPAETFKKDVIFSSVLPEKKQLAADVAMIVGTQTEVGASETIVSKQQVERRNKRILSKK